MVITYDNKEKNAKLALLQTETLARLNEALQDRSGDVPDL